ncbi:MAG TPA: 3-deoxy-manno-octulosonate cytidylyltransferase, partial [Skermanella sp.]|nr:3-deoxy-manno-octulosonate cytidylyltransferase [Skermanella sp.]
MPTNPIIVIPARLASTRLPGKPLADIHGEPMIVHVWRRGIEAGIGPVVVACAEPEIADAITKAGGQAVLTRPDHPSGSDRIYEALRTVDPDGKHDAVVNVQGDLPTIAPETIRAAYELLETEGVDIGTLAVEIIDASERGNPNVVKAVVERAPGAATGRALYFTRATAPTGEAPLLHHIGLYAYRTPALARFVSLPPSHLEQQEKLEQLR